MLTVFMLDTTICIHICLYKSKKKVLTFKIVFMFKDIALCCYLLAFTLLCPHLHEKADVVIARLNMALSNSAQLNHNFLRHCARNSAHDFTALHESVP